jgi:hypothetical protein
MSIRIGIGVIDRPRQRCLLILQRGSYRTDSCVIEYFDWNGGEAGRFGSTPVGKAEACFSTVDNTLAGLR